MTAFDVLHFPDERLRLKATPIRKIDSQINDIAHNMLDTMYLEGGIGLAATQVNIQKRIVVIDLSENKDEPLILINPKILKFEGKENTQEGCLSVPDYFDTVERAKNIEFCYETLDKKTITTKADGLLAICVQHEIDHLDGVTLLDRASRPHRRKWLQQQKKRRKKG